jgi:triphosphoribosyl-dephospho-CoA synthase
VTGPPPDRPCTPEDVAAAAQLACLLEASAPKPGNVSPGRHFHDTRYEDFLASAAAIGPALAVAGSRPLGETILHAGEATRRWTSANTNLGIVLLLAPLARAALTADPCADLPADQSVDRSVPRPGGPPHRDDTATGAGHPTESPRLVAERAPTPDPGPRRHRHGVPAGNSPLTLPLRARLAQALAETTVADAAALYAAIRLASPGGLGTVDAEDVRGAPTVTLREAMALAADRDGVAREYATDFATTFELGAPTLRRARQDGLDWADATVETYLTLLAAAPDTHVARKRGQAAAAEVTRLARAALAAGGVRTPAGRQAVAALDAALRDTRNVNNPGTTADLTAAAIFVALLEGGWRRQEESSHAHTE